MAQAVDACARGVPGGERMNEDALLVVGMLWLGAGLVLMWVIEVR